MKKRLIALLFALSLLLTALPPAQADDKVLISSLEELKQYLRIHALSLSETRLKMKKNAMIGASAIRTSLK